MRVTSQRTRQALLVLGEHLDPETLPEKIELYDQFGNPIVLGGEGATLPAGGTTDQLLTKQSAADFDATWEDPPTPPLPLPPGGADNTVLTKQSAADLDVDWEALPPAVPSDDYYERSWSFTATGWETDFNHINGDSGAAIAGLTGLVQQADGLQTTDAVVHALEPKNITLDDSVQIVEYICAAGGHVGIHARVEDPDTKALVVAYANNFQDVARMNDGTYQFMTNGSLTANWTAGQHRWLKMVTKADKIRLELWRTDPEVPGTAKIALTQYMLEYSWSSSSPQQQLFMAGHRPRPLAIRWAMDNAGRIVSYKIRRI